MAAAGRARTIRLLDALGAQHGPHDRNLLARLRATKKDVYLAKALSIANNFTRVQRLHDGDYPTMFTPHPMNYWLNNAIYPARVMITLQRDLAAIGRAPAP